MEREILFIAIAAVIAALVTFLVTYIIANSTIKKVKAELFLKKGELSSKEALLLERQSVYEKTISQMRESHEKTVSQMKEAHEQAIKEIKASSEQTLKMQVDALRNEVTLSADRILKDREESLSKNNKDGLDEILSPLKESIESMKKALSENEKQNIQTSTDLKASLENAVKTMGERTADIGAKADNLSEALTGRPKTQGCWGENFLDDILAKEGLVKGLHYDREVAGDDLSRPDFVFHFMEGMDRKDLIVDSKVSLTAFVEYVNAEDEQTKKDALTRHVKSIKKHIDELASKDYAKKVDASKRFADYVIMFMPIDMAYRVAIDEDYNIWQYAYSKGVIISTEQTIMPFLKIIRLTWNKYSQDRNIMEIMSAADTVVERVGLFYDSYKDLGSRLKATMTEYNKGLVKIKDDGKSITTSARQLMRLGAQRKKGKELIVPEDLLILDSDEEE